MRLFLAIIFVTAPTFAFSDENKRVITKYKQFTEVDLSGSSVEGKARTPELFYIFQRKRAAGHDAVSLPSSFAEHRAETFELLKKAVPE